MAKRKKKLTLLSLILSLVGIAGAVLSYIALAFNFINIQTQYKVGSSTTTNNTPMSLSKWFEYINNAQEANASIEDTMFEGLQVKIDGWAAARVFLIITLVLVAIVAIALVIKFFVNNKILNLATLVVAVLTILSAVVFLIMVYSGGSALVGKAENIKYLADVGAWFVTLGAVVAGGMGIAVARK